MKRQYRRLAMTGLLGLLGSSAMGATRPLHGIPAGGSLPKDLDDKFQIRDKPSTESRSPSSASPWAAIPSRRPAKEPMWVNERHVFEMTYFGVPAGEFDVRVLPHKYIQDRKVYNIHGVATSSSVFSLFYRVNDELDSYMDYDALFSHRYHLVMDESKQSRDSHELYDAVKNQSYFWNRWWDRNKGFTEVKKSADISPLSQDNLSALFYVRFLPLEDGSVVTYPVASEGHMSEVIVTVMGREMIDTPMGRIRAIRIKPEIRYQGVIKKNPAGDSFMFVSDDSRRKILRVDAKVRIGTVVASLKRFEDGIAP